jgi:broad specificity phosphatase PhoE
LSVLYLVRHGQAAFGEQDYDQLTALGVEQCQRLARHWAALGREVPQVFAGRLRRQQASAEAFAVTLGDVLGRPLPVEVIDGLEEYDHVALLRSYAARTRPDASVDDLNGNRKAFHKFIEQALEAWAGGELPDFAPFGSFRGRCVAALEDLMRRLGRGQTAVVFGSAGSLAAAIQPIIGLGDLDLLRLKLNFHNTGITKLLFNEQSASIESVNVLSHLEQPGLAGLITHR